MSSDTHGPNSLLGRTIGGYQLVDILGDGLTGVVFLGERTEAVRGEMERTGRSAINWPEQVAIKLLVLPWQLKDNERQEFRRRFEREAETLQRLHHPNILSLIAFGHVEDLDSSYMILPYLSGGSLQKRLQERQTPMPLDDVENVLRLLASAVDEAHRHGIVHRDIKPENILFGADGAPYLTDFSVASLLADATARLTKSQMVLGTPNYMAPEAKQGQVSPAVDIYSLGMVTYEMVTGLRASAQNPPLSPGQLRPDLPPAAGAVLLMAIDQDPARRFQSAADFAVAFSDGLLGKFPARATPRLAEEPFAATYPSTPSAGATAQPSPAKKKRRGLLIGVCAALLAATLSGVAVAGFSRFGHGAPNSHAATVTIGEGTSTPSATGQAHAPSATGGTRNGSPVPTTNSNNPGGSPPTAAAPTPTPTITPVPLPVLVVSTDSTQSTDHQSHGSGNPYIMSNGSQYSNVTIQAGAFASAIPHCGAGGPGLVQFTATGTVQIDGTLTVNGEGYCGGPGIQGSGGGVQGESYTGAGTTSAAANGGGGGGASGSDSGGAGGGYGSQGQDAVNATGISPTYGGNTYGDPTLFNLYLGSGGGSSGAVFSNVGAPGGNGGGAVSIRASAIIVNGSISANGAGGSQNCQNGNPSECRGSGGGSGGSIFLHANTISIGNNLVTATGGSGAAATHGGKLASGGNGGAGRIRIEYTQSFSGSTNPAPSLAQV